MTAEFLIVDAHFRELLATGNAAQDCARLWTGGAWVEGPCYLRDPERLIFSDIPNNRTMCWSEATGETAVLQTDALFPNGHTVDREGRLITCEHGRRCVARTDANGATEVLVDRYQGKRLNSPNDVVVKRDGTIWFTDPPYGILSNHEGYQAESEIGACNVYRFDPMTRELSAVVRSMVHPNGLAFSPDETVLYVADTSAAVIENGHHHIKVFTVSADGTRVIDDCGDGDQGTGSGGGGRIFVDMHPGLADGFRCDEQGNVWTSAGDGVHCYSADGRLLGKILLPHKTSNCVFGGVNRDRLFITASTDVFVVQLRVRGA